MDISLFTNAYSTSAEGLYDTSGMGPRQPQAYTLSIQIPMCVQVFGCACMCVCV